jgi:MYXO-CTERM domain-containing protein
VVTPSITSLASVTDIITDPTGKILLADFGPNDYNFTDPNGGIYLLAPVAVPEPASGTWFVVAVSILGAALLRRRRGSTRPLP